jgi:methyl-accepting chemotaxis protein
MIREIQQSARQINDASTHIATSSEQIALASGNQSNAAASMASSVQQMTASIGQVSENAEHAQEVSQDAGQLSLESGRVIGEAVNGILRVADSVRAAAEEIDGLGEQSKQISSVVGVIRDIGDQTNLLALNAAIEAARAGESGRGFAVVADEVRKLAERTASSTADISHMVQGIQTKTNAVVQRMQAEVERVGKEVAQAHEAQFAVTSIQNSAEHVVRMVNEITVALREQSSASSSLANNVEQIARMANENAAAVGTALDGARQQNALAANLLRSVSQFQV